MSVSNDTNTERQAALYRLYAADGSLLYIGSSYNPQRRYRDHYRKPWWPTVVRRVEEWHPSKDDAYAAEMKAIAAERPAYNHMGTPQYVPPSEKAAARRNHLSGELTVKEIMAKHGISRQSLHTYRQESSFPLPVSRPGTGGLRWREDELAAWFAANPKQQGKKRDQFVSHQQGEPVTTTTDTRKDLYAFAMQGKEHSPDKSERASEKIEAFRATVLREAAAFVEELVADGEHDPDCLVSELRHLAAKRPEAQDG
ncbi:GIY-YIG nuclease family protein [Streptomyces sp. NPDC002285]